jgi:hypothetical protein
VPMTITAIDGSSRRRRSPGGRNRFNGVRELTTTRKPLPYPGCARGDRNRQNKQANCTRSIDVDVYRATAPYCLLLRPESPYGLRSAGFGNRDRFHSGGKIGLQPGGRIVLVNGDMEQHRPADYSAASPSNSIDSPRMTRSTAFHDSGSAIPSNPSDYRPEFSEAVH